jgi:predicted TIM-barrel fold metal-dependent hydrolase
MPIDMHAHWMPKALSDALRERTEPPMIPTSDDGAARFDTAESRLAEMDEHGFNRGVLSLSPAGGLDSLPLEDALPLCRTFNDATAAACSAYPDRYSGFALLPSADVRAMVDEFERVMAFPGMVGAVLPGDGFLSLRRAEKFRPIFEAGDALGALFLVHYGRLADDSESPRPDLSDNGGVRRGTLDMQARISSNMITFCMTDFLAAYPNVTVISHNLGGNIPFEIERLDHRSMMDRPHEELPSKRIRAARLLVDCNSFGSRAIEMAVAVYGAEKIVCGTDGTSFGMDWTRRAVGEARISESEKQAILDGNAAAALAHANRPTAAAAS